MTKDNMKDFARFLHYNRGYSAEDAIEMAKEFEFNSDPLDDVDRALESLNEINLDDIDFDLTGEASESAELPDLDFTDFDDLDDDFDLDL